MMRTNDSPYEHHQDEVEEIYSVLLTQDLHRNIIDYYEVNGRVETDVIGRSVECITYRDSNMDELRLKIMFSEEEKVDGHEAAMERYQEMLEEITQKISDCEVAIAQAMIDEDANQVGMKMIEKQKHQRKLEEIEQMNELTVDRVVERKVLRLKPGKKYMIKMNEDPMILEWLLESPLQTSRSIKQERFSLVKEVKLKSDYSGPPMTVVTCQGPLQPDGSNVSVLIETEGRRIRVIEDENDELHSSRRLMILGAVYGRQDVTNMVRESVDIDFISIQASNNVFGDNWPGVCKTLTVVYGFMEEDSVLGIGVEVVKEMELLLIDEESKFEPIEQSSDQETLNVLGASYGINVVSDDIRESLETGDRFVRADSRHFGNSMGHRHSMTVVTCQGPLHSDGSNVTVSCCVEGQRIRLQQNGDDDDEKEGKQLIILGAVYGKEDVTDEVRRYVDSDYLYVEAINSVFGDPWRGVQKSLTVVYGFLENDTVIGIGLKCTCERSKLIVSDESMIIPFKDAEESNALHILGASYGLNDITESVRDIVSGGSLRVKACNANFGDSMHGTRKSMTIVSCSGPLDANDFSNINISYCLENEYVRLYDLVDGEEKSEEEIVILAATYGDADVTDIMKKNIHQSGGQISASNQVFGDPWYGTYKTLSVVYALVHDGDIIGIGTKSVGERQELEISIDDDVGDFLPLGDFSLLGATYGSRVVTESLSRRQETEIRASNQNFGDPLPNIRKSLTVVYCLGELDLSGQGVIVLTCREGESVKLK